MDFLPDSNILVNFFNGIEPDKGFLEKLIAVDSLHISSITIAEVLAKASTKEKEDLLKLCELGQIELIDKGVVIIAGDYRKNFLQKKKKVYLLDCLIAATCKLHKLTLVTNNIKDYPMKDIKVVRPR